MRKSFIFRPFIKKFYNYNIDEFMILNYFPIAQNIVNKKVSEIFFSEVYMSTYFTIFFPFTGLIPVYI